MTRKELIKMHNILLDNAKVGCADLTAIHHVSFDSFKFVIEQTIQALSQEPCDDVVSIRKDVLKCRVGKLVVYNIEWLKEHWQMEMDIVCGVKPCDDAIIRDELLKAIETWDKFGYTETGCFVREPKGDYVPYIHYDDVIKSIKGMPSVTQKSGKWICIDDYHLGKFKCSVCQTEGFPNTVMYKPTWNFCPNCGAKMESEE